MIFDGKQFSHELADELAERVKTFDRAPSLGVCMVGNNPVSKRYVGLKKRMAGRVGIGLEVHHYDESISTEELAKEISRTLALHDGYIVQLPLPSHIDTSHILNSIPAEKDVDMLSSHVMDSFYKNETELIPPVVGVFAEILQKNNVDVVGKKVVVVGYGRLVGKPAEHWFKKYGASVTVVDLGDSLEDAARDADIIALGAGAPGILRKEMVKDGVVVLDAGTSEDGGALKGDAEPSVADKASLFTPVPGGIGPVTVVVLFKNLVNLYTKHHAS